MGTENRSTPHDSRRHRTTTIILLAAFGIAGCGYPEIGPTAYETAKAFHSIMNDRDPTALARAREHIETARREQRLSESEHELFEEFLLQAEAGDWTDAERSVLDLLAAQND